MSPRSYSNMSSKTFYRMTEMFISLNNWDDGALDPRVTIRQQKVVIFFNILELLTLLPDNVI